MKSSLEHIYYRGSLDFCNYKCFYCPFSKKSFDQQVLKEDEEELNSFFQQVLNLRPKTIFLLPYGEALVHPYYMKFLAKITNLDFIEEVGVQTNVSFSLKELLQNFEENCGNLSKLNLWSSFHPTEVNIKSFSQKICNLKANNIKLTVGSVANTNNLDLLISLRQVLPDSVYLWINKMDGRKKAYNSFEIQNFLSIDPYFNLELLDLKSDLSKCSAGEERLFLSSKGGKTCCNISKFSLEKDRICKSKTCSCFLSYSNRKDISLLKRFENNGIFRSLKNPNKELIFFDLDGTLLDEDKLDPSLFESLSILKEDNLLFLNTSLPYKKALRKLGSLIYLFDGGIFSNGGHIRFFKYDYNLDFHLNPEVFENILKDKKLNFFRDGEKYIYKFILFKKDFENKLTSSEKKLLHESYNISYDDKLIYLNNILVNKEKSINIVKRFYLLSDKNITFFGNSQNDILENKNIRNIIVDGKLSELLMQNFKVKSRF